MDQFAEAVFFVELVRVESRQDPAPEILQLGMLDDRRHQPFAQTATAVFFEDVNIAEISEGGVVGDDAREAYLILAFIDPKRQGIFYRPLGLFSRTVFRPVRILAQVFLNRV